MVSFRQLAVLAVSALPAISALPYQSVIQDNLDLNTETTTAEDSIRDTYIITLEPGLDELVVNEHISFVESFHVRRANSAFTGVGRKWGFRNFNAYQAHFDDETVQMIKSQPNVLSVERETLHQLLHDVPRGLDSIPHEKYDKTPNKYQYEYNSAAGGKGTFAYMIDSGILTTTTTTTTTTHDEFSDNENNAKLGYNAVEGEGGIIIPFEDMDGHGGTTHATGTVCDKTYGIAKKATTTTATTTTCISVKIFNGEEGTHQGEGVVPTRHILDGYNWAVNDILTRKRESVSVINMSLGPGALHSVAENAAVQAAFEAGVLTTVLAAAGNNNNNNNKDDDAANFYSPPY